MKKTIIIVEPPRAKRIHGFGVKKKVEHHKLRNRRGERSLLMGINNPINSNRHPPMCV
jgi:hypothetical protein